MTSSSSSGRAAAGATRSRRRFLAVLLVGLLPWTVLIHDAGTSLVFSFGLVNAAPTSFVSLPEYLLVHTGGLPRRLQAWPAGVILYAGALASSIGGLRAFEDPRLTGGLLFFAGVAHGQVSYGLYRVYGDAGPTVLPLGTLAAWAVVWWYYWPLIRRRGIHGAE